MKVTFRMMLLVGLTTALVSVVATWRLYGNVQTAVLTAEITEWQLNRQPTRLLKAYRADGSTAWSAPVTMPDGTTIQRHHIRDVQKNAYVILDEATQSVMTYYFAPDMKLANTGRGCTAVEGERSTMFGYEVVRVVRESGSKREEFWAAPSLNCLVVKSTVTVQEEGQTIEIVRRELTNLVRGNPDPTLFTIPPSYVERTPSKYRAMLRERYGLKTDDGGSMHEDMRYLRNR